MPDPKTSTATANLPFLFSGDRTEVSNVALTAIEGTMPTNLSGYIYLMTQCGTVNSGGYPYPKEINGKQNPEYGSPVLNGNGMIFIFDLSTSGSITTSSKLVKTPSYYADVASRIDGGPARSNADFKHLHFENAGISRMSFFLGTVNYANTAIIPVNFKSDSGPSILATYDTGRPIKIDPNTLDFVTPIGLNKDWLQGTPPFLQAPFPMFETTAHPSWDAKEQVLYVVNFSKSGETELSRTFLYELLRKDKEAVRVALKKIALDFKQHHDKDRAIAEIMAFIEDAPNKKKKQAAPEISKKQGKKGFFNSVGSFLWKFLKFFIKDKIEHDIEHKIESATTTIDEVLLVRVDGTQNLQKWKLVDETGKSLIIYQCMHQTSISENYIILMDSSFKFAFDLLINNPVPGEPLIDELIRILSSKTILPSTQVWIVKKSDLDSTKDSVVARAVKGQPIPGLSNEPYGGVPMECVHFSTEYEETNGEITIYTAHNNATCLAEWIRPYDVNYFTQDGYTDTNISNYAAGQTALSSVGKYVINGPTATFVPGKNKIIQEEGNLPPVGDLNGQPLTNVGPNTWGIGLYAYRGMISPTLTGSKIKQLYFVSFGSQPELLTDFIQALYEEVPNRKLTLEDILAYTKCGIPQSIIGIDTDSMTINDHFELAWGVYPMSIQFIPMPQPTPIVPPQKDGYIWLTVKVLEQENSVFEYVSQIWLFDAANIGQGPICKLGAPDFNFCTSLHITWLPTKQTPFTSGHNLDIRADFNESIENSFLDPIEYDNYKKFFEDYVYPNF